MGVAVFTQADGRGCFDAVHFGHLHVHENHVVLAIAEELHRFGSIRGRTHTMPAGFENSHQQAPVHGVIFRDEDRKRTRGSFFRCPGGRL